MHRLHSLTEKIKIAYACVQQEREREKREREKQNKQTNNRGVRERESARRDTHFFQGFINKTEGHKQETLPRETQTEREREKASV